MIPISGDIHNPKGAVLATIGNIFKNAFVKAFNPTVPGSIDTQDIRVKEAPKD